MKAVDSLPSSPTYLISVSGWDLDSIYFLKNRVPSWWIVIPKLKTSRANGSHTSAALESPRGFVIPQAAGSHLQSCWSSWSKVRLEFVFLRCSCSSVMLMVLAFISSCFDNSALLIHQLGYIYISVNRLFTFILANDLSRPIFAKSPFLQLGQ